MTEFVKYQHVEKWGNDEVEGIEDGKCYVFPKIDGTNGSIWYNKEDGKLRFGSRNRELSLDADNQGFMATFHECTELHFFFGRFPDAVLRGEWLVKHTIGTYRDSAWRKFYIYDVEFPAIPGYENRYVDYEQYCSILDEAIFSRLESPENFGIEVIAPLEIITNPKDEDIQRLAESNTYLIKEDKGVGEGVVVKRYNYFNQYGNQIWAKFVLSEFKEKHRAKMGSPERENHYLEEDIVAKVCTKVLCEKEFAKLKLMLGKWESRSIPRLLETVWHTIISEEMYYILKTFKNPKIDFARLQKYVTEQIKTNLPGVF
jgi:hypothetical protein